MFQVDAISLSSHAVSNVFDIKPGVVAKQVILFSGNLGANFYMKNVFVNIAKSLHNLTLGYGVIFFSDYCPRQFFRRLKLFDTYYKESNNKYIFIRKSTYLS